MPKPNRLLVRDDWHTLDAEYLAGARAARAGLATGRGTAAWRAGERNEIDLEHVRFGLDVLSLPQSGRDVDVDPDLPRMPGRGAWRPLHRDTALLAYMEATGSLREAALACQHSDWLPDSWRFADPSEVARIRTGGAAYQLMRPARLRAALSDRGVPVSLDMAKALLRRLEHEHRTRFEPLSFVEETRVEDAPGEVRLLLSVLDRRQGREWLAVPAAREVDADARRPAGWARGLAARMQGAGLGFLVRAVDAGGLCLTGKGCSAAHALGRAERASHEREARALAFA